MLCFLLFATAVVDRSNNATNNDTRKKISNDIRKNQMPKNIFFKIGCRFLGEEEMRDCHQKEQCSIFIFINMYSFHLQKSK